MRRASTAPEPADEVSSPPRLVMILRGAGFGRIKQVEADRYEAWTVNERYLIDENGEVVEGGRLAEGLQSFLDTYYVP